MADAYLRMTYVLEVTDREMRLIGLALAGKLADREDKAAAAELNVKMLRLQQIRLKEQEVRITGALNKTLEEAPDAGEEKT